MAKNTIPRGKGKNLTKIRFFCSFGKNSFEWMVDS